MRVEGVWGSHRRMGWIWVVPLFALVVKAKKTETIISAGNWVSVDSFDVGSGTSYNKWVVDRLKNIQLLLLQ